jgi:hypothetical protein
MQHVIRRRSGRRRRRRKWMVFGSVGPVRRVRVRVRVRVRIMFALVLVEYFFFFFFLLLIRGLESGKSEPAGDGDGLLEKGPTSRLPSTCRS